MQNDDRYRDDRPHGGGRRHIDPQDADFSAGRGGMRGPRHHGSAGPEYGDAYEHRGYGHWHEQGDRYARQPHYGDWSHDEPFYGREQGGQPPQYGYGRPNPYGPQYEQGGRYPGTRPLGDRQWLGSRSDDPGQSSYGGFRGQDPSYQRQDLRTAQERRSWQETAWGDAAEADYGYGAPGYGGYGHGLYDRGGPHEDGLHHWHGRPEQNPGWRDDRSWNQDRWGSSYPAGRFPARRAGVDPKGYTRSDERVREGVCEHLSRSGLDVSDVEVNVKNGEVTLQGTVPDRRTKRAVEDCVEDCAGVKDVENRVKVSSGQAAGTISN